MAHVPPLPDETPTLKPKALQRTQSFSYGPIRHHQSIGLMQCGHVGKRKLLNGDCAECKRIELNKFRPSNGHVISRFNPLSDRDFKLEQNRKAWHTPPLDIIRPPTASPVQPLDLPGPKLILNSAEIYAFSTRPLIEILSLPLQQNQALNYEAAIDELLPELNKFAGENHRIAIIVKIIDDLKIELLAIRPNVEKNKLAALHTILKTNYFLLKARWFIKQPYLQYDVKFFPAIDDAKFMADEKQIDQVFVTLMRILSFKDGRLFDLKRISSLLEPMHALDFSLRSLLDAKNLQNFNDMSRAVWMFDMFDILFALASRLNKIIAVKPKNMSAHKYLLVTYFLQLKIISHYHKYPLFNNLGLQHFISSFLVLLQFISIETIKNDPRLSLQNMSAVIQEYFSRGSLKPKP